jgi:hypothetical protein
LSSEKLILRKGREFGDGDRVSFVATLFKPCAQYNDFLDKAQLLTQKLLKQ